jgi:hypothetical protein
MQGLPELPPEIIRKIYNKCQLMLRDEVTRPLYDKMLAELREYHLDHSFHYDYRTLAEGKQIPVIRLGRKPYKLGMTRANTSSIDPITNERRYVYICPPIGPHNNPSDIPSPNGSITPEQYAFLLGEWSSKEEFDKCVEIAIEVNNDTQCYRRYIVT